MVTDPRAADSINNSLGIIGFTEPDIPTRQPPAMSEGLKFQESEVLQPMIDELRNERKVDLAIIVSHVGLPRAVGLAESLKGVDVMLSADTHERTYQPIIRGNTWIVEAGAFGSIVGLLDIMVDSDNRISSRSWRLIELFPEDPEVKHIVENALAPHRERMDEVIGYTDVWLARYRLFGGWLPRISGLTVEFKKQAPADQRLQNLLVDGEAIEPEGMYRIAAGNSPGAPDNSVHPVAGCQRIRKVETTTHEAVRSHLYSHSPIRTEGDPHVRCIDCDGILRLQYLQRIRKSPGF